MSSKKLTTQVYSQNGEKIKDIELNPEIFNVEVKNSVVHQVVVAQMANSRTAIAHTKTRGEVRGGGVKPWRQKGTGRARVGSIRSPLWVGGGVTFGPRKDRNFSQKVNKKMKRKALFMCLSDKINNDLLVVLDKLNLEKGKTKELVEIIKNLKSVLKLKETRNKKQETKELKNEGSKKQETEKKSSKFDIKDYKLSTLIIVPKEQKEVFRAGRNLENVKILGAESLNVLDLLKYKRVVCDEKVLEIIKKVYLK